MDVSVIIVNYNTKDLTQKCIDSIFQHTHGVIFEVILIDNASCDGSIELFREDTRITFVESPENLGFGKANNVASDYARGRYLFLLNPDTQLVNNAIKIFFDYMNEHPDVGICGGNLYDGEMHPTHSHSLFFPSILVDIDNLFGGLLKKKIFKDRFEFNCTQQPLKVAYITGADMFMGKELFDRVGKFSSDFFLYYEETDLAYRVKKDGYISVNIPDAKIIHLEGKSFRYTKDRIAKSMQGRKTFYKRSYGTFYTCFANFLLGVTYISRLMLFPFFKEDRLKMWWVSLCSLIK